MLEPSVNLIHQESVLKIDFFVRKATRYREVAFDRRQRVQLGSAEGYVVRKEDLILSKIGWTEDSQSDVQKRDLRNLMATDYGEEYLEHGLKELAPVAGRRTPEDFFGCPCSFPRSRTRRPA